MGCFSAIGLRKIVIIDENLNSIKCIELLEENLISSIKKINMGEFVLQQNNAPCH